MQLQRLHGNRAVTDLLARARGEAPTDEAPSQLDEVARGIKAARGGGQQLDGHTLARMNNAFGADFSGVRVHTDAHADRLNLAVEARAFATGRDIFFRQGTYNPGSSAGRELLAHELTHVVQQGGAGGLQAKLSVSEPGDPEEQEADRIASAVMAQEHCGRAGPVMRTASPLRAGNVLLHRDKDSAVPGELKPVAPTVDAPPAAAASNPADPADQVTLTWFVDWQNKEMGAPVSATSNARTGRDAAYGTLKLLPAAGAGNATTLPWVNAASSGGAVEVGAWQQAKGKGGMVSTGISWGRPPSAIATVSVEATTDGAKPPPKGELLAKQKAASSAAATALEKALELKGGLEMLKAEVLAAANGAVGGSSYKVSADVRLDPKPAYSRAVTAVPYEGAAADDRRTATVVVPTVVEKLKGSNTVEIENRMKQTDASQSASKDGKTVEKYDSKTESLLNEVTTNFTTIFNTAYQDWRSKIKKTSLSASGSFVGSVGGSAGASGTIDDLTIDFGTILGLLLIENPPLAFALKKAVGTGKLGGKGKVDFAAELKAKAGASASWSEEDVQQTLSKVDTQITHAISTHMRSMVESVAIKKSVETHDASKAAQTAKEVASSKKNAATAETVGVQYVIGEPELHITNG